MSTPPSTRGELSGALPAGTHVAAGAPWLRRRIGGVRRTLVALWRGFLDAWSDHMTKIGVVLLSLFVLAAIFGPQIIDTPPFQTNRLENGAVPGTWRPVGNTRRERTGSGKTLRPSCCTARGWR